MQEFSKKEKFLLLNTLNCIPQILLGEAVLLDLRNETSVAGRVVNADGYSNIELEDVVFIDQQGLQYPFDNYMLRFRMIRQIHVPEHINIDTKLRSWIEKGVYKKKYSKSLTKGKRTFKQKRAEVRHKEILNKIEKEMHDKQAK